MLPEPVFTQYPEFVPDQLLTNDNLNDLFGYLDQQGRITRVNLIGIGIVCGLEVKVAADGSSITVTKGCGVTSEGYMVELVETTYQHYKKYDALKEHLYEKFTAGNPATQLFKIDELTVNATDEGAVALDKSYLEDKIVLLFVELLKKDAKNCDPDSCDDKGVNVTVTIRPLLVSVREDIGGLMTGMKGGSNGLNQKINNLPALPLPRFNVPATNLVTTANIIDAYRDVLDEGFIKQIEAAIGKLFILFKPFLKDLYANTGYESFYEVFKFLAKDAAVNDLIVIQYYYDFISDVLATYTELRDKGFEFIAECCPDTTLFPRHLLLGPATGNFGSFQSDYRDYFIPSPAIANNSYLVGELRSLFAKLVLLKENFSVPEIAPNGDPKKVQLRITPSLLGKFTLSQKAIPYYYGVVKNDFSLLKRWSYKLTKAGKENYNQSYHAPEYLVQHDEINDPLRFDLEPYNFFRIEGIIGKSYTSVLRFIQSEINENRLPFDVVVLRTGTFTTVPANFVLPDGYECHFDDLAISYEIARREWEAIVGKTIEYLNANKKEAATVISPRLLDTYISRLYLAKKFMYADMLLYIKARVEFMDLYSWLENEAQVIRTGIYKNDKRSDKFTEDLVDHFDAIVLNSEKGALRAVYEQYDRKVAEIYQKLFLSNFLKANPGIQHKAGVPPGGTFVVVYHEGISKPVVTTRPQNRLEVIAAETPILQQADVAKKTDVSQPIVAPTAPAAMKVAAPAATVAVDKKEETASASAKAINVKPAAEINKEVAQPISFEDNIVIGQLKRAVTVDQWAIIEKYLPSRGVITASDLETLTQELTNGIVVADFYLPYRCGTDCDCIKFIINEAEPTTPPEKLTIKLADTQFCQNDTGSYAVTVSPTGGAVTGEGIATDDSGAFIFKPSAVAIDATAASKSITLTYTKGDNDVTTNVTVFRFPTADFSIAIGTSSANARIFTATNNIAGVTYAWTFSDGGTAGQSQATHQYAQPGTYTVTLTVTNGKCTNSETQTVVIANPKTCGSLAAFVTDFNGLAALDQESFAAFQKNFKAYAAVVKFFEQVKTLESKESAAQLQFLGSAATCKDILTWLKQLKAMIVKRVSLLHAIALFRILTSLQMYAFCLLPDMNSEEAKTLLEFFTSVVPLVKGWVGDLNSDVKDQIVKFLAAVNAAIAQTKANGEDDEKQAYIKLLENIAKVLNGYV